jgi:hypothetical protein
MTPSSASTSRTSLPSTRPRADGPIRTPTMISPATAGNPSRSETSAASFAATRTTRRSMRMSVTLIPWP